MKKKGEEILPEIPLQLVMKTVVRHVPLQPMEVHAGADVHLQLLEEPLPERWMTEGCCDPTGSLHWSRLLAGPVDPWGEEPMQEQLCWQNL
ncbi:hypothetical protein BTVI_140186 [Pitangus sulphuratus]|nr:hypothetical protein BTVI_140186 [Pitangus sulphuratus]